MNIHIKYKNLLLVGVGIVLAIILFGFEGFHTALLSLGNLGFLGAFLGGLLFASSFTVASGTVILLVLSESLPALEVGLIAGLGAVFADSLIFHFTKDHLSEELSEIYSHLDRKKRIKKLFHSKHFRWMLPILGAIIIASPLPDELGVGLLSTTKISNTKFLIISYLANSIGIFLVVVASNFIKP
jgi:hypothetical protein